MGKFMKAAKNKALKLRYEEAFAKGNAAAEAMQKMIDEQDMVIMNLNNIIKEQNVTISELRNNLITKK